ncbi:unnamed protein product [Didymodactylos carnosus]|uniref:Reverse transcriptase domain-containing protein n=1 Tax=Didymodactylos carnosus TaxID=1234261 RepID=A0A8S2E4J1_9BILA|nr:unnamed protein product [Didymodactylos carnosus]CAF3913133.1 unnamed protein product [Didymodactylos carnosus]
MGRNRLSLIPAFNDKNNVVITDAVGNVEVLNSHFASICTWRGPQINLSSGIISKDSTTNLLLDVVHKINVGLEDHRYVRAVLLDFQKTFDNVSHRGLLFKLERKGIQGRALKWFESYLTGRTVQTILEGVTSSPMKIDKGVPQGSVLGPLLFLLYIDDLPLKIESIIKLYADDALLVCHHKDPLVATGILNKDLERVYSWSVRWCVPLNLKKCESITFSSGRNRTRALVLPPLMLNSVYYIIIFGFVVDI